MVATLVEFGVHEDAANTRDKCMFTFSILHNG